MHTTDRVFKLKSNPPNSQSEKKLVISRWTRNMPVIVLTSYLVFSIILFAFGPWPWDVVSPFKFYSYLSIYTIAFVGGYLSASRSEPKKYSFPIDGLTLFKLGLLISGLLLPLNYVSRQQLGVSLMEGIVDPGDVYQTVQEASKGLVSGQGSAIGYIVVYSQVFFGVLTALVFPYFVVHWSKLSFPLRAAGFLSVVGSVAVGVFMTGATKVLADTLGLLPWFVWIALRKRSVRSISYPKLVGVGVIAIVALFFVLNFFGRTVTGRSGRSEIGVTDQTVGISADRGNVFIRYFPETMKGPLTAMSHYITQGYYGMGLCLELPFVPCFGLGNSVFLMYYLDKVLGEGIMYERTYTGRAEIAFGEASGMGRWQSIYPWLASDVTFPGVAVVIFFIGRLMAKCWIDVMGGENPFALSLFSFLLISVLYFPANNQIVQNTSQCVPFYLTLLCWWKFRK